MSKSNTLYMSELDIAHDKIHELVDIMEKLLKHPTGFMEPYMKDERTIAEDAIASVRTP